MRWKSQVAIDRAIEGRVAEPDVAVRDRICVDLQARGVDGATAEMMALHVAREVDRTGTDAYYAVLDGVALSCRLQVDTTEQLEHSAADLQEIERLMSAFAGELSKLDEVLEVLAAYLRRMRTSSPATTPRLLH